MDGASGRGDNAGDRSVFLLPHNASLGAEDFVQQATHGREFKLFSSHTRITGHCSLFSKQAADIVKKDNDERADSNCGTAAGYLGVSNFQTLDI